MDLENLFFEYARKIDLIEFNKIIESDEKEAKEDGYDFYDHNTLYQDATLYCLLDYLSEISEEDFHRTFSYYNPSILYIVMDGEKIDSYVALIVG